MKKYLIDLNAKSKAGDLTARINLLFITMYDFLDTAEAELMDSDLKHVHPILDVMYNFCRDPDINPDHNKLFL